MNICKSCIKDKNIENITSSDIVLYIKENNISWLSNEITGKQQICRAIRILKDNKITK